MNSNKYRQWRQRRRAAWLEANHTRKHSDTEADRLIEFASMWAPFGGATEEEILVNFGMTTRRFIERLWQVVPESNCVPDEIRRLANAYPRHRRTGEPAAQVADGPTVPKQADVGRGPTESTDNGSASGRQATQMAHRRPPPVDADDVVGSDVRCQSSMSATWGVPTSLSARASRHSVGFLKRLRSNRSVSLPVTCGNVSCQCFLPTRNLDNRHGTDTKSGRPTPRRGTYKP